MRTQYYQVTTRMPLTQPVLYTEAQERDHFILTLGPGGSGLAQFGNSINYRRLGKSGIKHSEIDLGGLLTFGHVSNERTGRELIDTANVYTTSACQIGEV